MEHIVQFAVSIDDVAITNMIQKNAERTITENIQRTIEKSIFSIGYGGKTEERLNYVAERLLLDWLDYRKDEIIQYASNALADKMIKTKAVKTAINNVLEGENK